LEITNLATEVTQELQLNKVQFLGEQDGSPERVLKERLSAVFIFHRNLERAYLAQVRYADEHEVALCLRCTDNQKQKITEVIGEVFGLIFGSHEHLDIVFLGQNQELALRQVCCPFYSKTVPSSLPDDP
jgi:hypothetical protein